MLLGAGLAGAAMRAVAAPASAPVLNYLDADGIARTFKPLSKAPITPLKRSVGLSSRHFQWTASAQEVVDLAKRAGYDAIAWAVQPGGHVDPQSVEQDLPRVVEMTRRAGLVVDLVETQLNDSSGPLAEALVRTLQRLRIRYYRAGQFGYDYGADIAPQIEAVKRRIGGLADLNARHGVTALFQNRSTQGDFGADIWDLWLALRDVDPGLVAIDYDLGHATVRSGRSGWIDGLALARRHVRAVSVRDFKWNLGDPIVPTAPIWRPWWTPLGEGMVDITGMLKVLGQGGFAGPINLQFDYYGLSGGAIGKMEVDLSRDQFVGLIRRDLTELRADMRELNFAG